MYSNNNMVMEEVDIVQCTLQTVAHSLGVLFRTNSSLSLELELSENHMKRSCESSDLPVSTFSAPGKVYLLRQPKRPGSSSVPIKRPPTPIRGKARQVRMRNSRPQKILYGAAYYYRALVLSTSKLSRDFCRAKIQFLFVATMSVLLCILPPAVYARKYQRLRIYVAQL